MVTIYQSLHLTQAEMRYSLTPQELRLMAIEVRLCEELVVEGRQALKERGCFTVDRMSPEQLMRVALEGRDRSW